MVNFSSIVLFVWEPEEVMEENKKREREGRGKFVSRKK